MTTDFWKGFEKKAVLGPAMDVGMAGMPSMLGYQIGKGHGMTTDPNVLEEAEPSKLKKLLAALLVPGYFGYRQGLLSGASAKDKAEEKEKKK